MKEEQEQEEEKKAVMSTVRRAFRSLLLELFGVFIEKIRIQVQRQQ